MESNKLNSNNLSEKATLIEKRFRDPQIGTISMPFGDARARGRRARGRLPNNYITSKGNKREG